MKNLSTVAVNWTVAALLIAAAPHLAAMPAWLGLPVLAAAAWRSLAAWRGWRPPGLLIRIALAAGGVALVAAAYGSLWGRRAATGLLCIMLAAKLFEMFRPRDARLVAALCFFLVATQFLFSEKLVYLGYLLAGCWMATIALWHIQQGAHSAVPGRRVPVAAGAMLATAMPFALVMFMLFPRLAQPLWGLPDHVLDGRTGLSDTMSPGSIAKLYADDRPAFRVEFDGPVPSHSTRYWRGPVLWRFDGATWRRLSRGLRSLTTPSGPAAADYLYRVQLEPHETRWLFALDYPVSRPSDALLTADYELIRKRPVTGLFRYEVASNPDPGDRPRLSATMRRAALELPDGRNPRTLELARTLRQEYPSDRALVEAVLNWFNQENFYYSLETAPLGRHGADEFLFDLRTGFCEYYASAFAILMRAAGIPTRIVTGYQGGYWHAAGNYLLIRHSDAHAWTELWFPDSGWTRVDPTAAVSPARIRDGAHLALVDYRRGIGDWEWLRNLRNRYDVVQHLWNRWVLGFDAQRQQNMLAGLGLPRLPTGGLPLLLITALAVVMTPIAWLILRRERQARRDPAMRLWRRLLRRLRRRGLVHEASETPLEFALRANPALEHGTEFVQLALMFNRIRYGPEGTRWLPEFRRRIQDWMRR